MWAKEISEGAHVGATTHQGAPGGAGTPLVGTRCTPPLVLFAPKIHKYSAKNRVKFLGHSENFYFWVIFYCAEKTENRINMAFCFIQLTKTENKR